LLGVLVGAGFGPPDSRRAGFRPARRRNIHSAHDITRDVAPIVFSTAQAVIIRAGRRHSALSYSSIRTHARQTVQATATRHMPPWKPEPGYGDFIGQHRLTDAD
jgi:hypothetical protein